MCMQEGKRKRGRVATGIDDISNSRSQQGTDERLDKEGNVTRRRRYEGNRGRKQY